jgi:hypothetical protein
LIQCSDGEVYSLNPNGFTYYTDNNGGVYAEGVEKGTSHSFKYYGSSGVWKKYIDEADEGRLAIILPEILLQSAIDDINCTVECDIYHSNLLGTTGNSSYEGPGNISYIIYYSKTGKVEYIDEWGNTTYREMDSSWIDDYGAVYGIPVEILYLPINATYIKAEHLNLDISLSAPESNLGQMFGESDIRYSTNHSKKFREIFEAPSFKVNTKHPIVSQSHSYLICGKSIADANGGSVEAEQTICKYDAVNKKVITGFVPQQEDMASDSWFKTEPNILFPNRKKVDFAGNLFDGADIIKKP